MRRDRKRSFQLGVFPFKYVSNVRFVTNKEEKEIFLLSRGRDATTKVLL